MTDEFLVVVKLLGLREIDDDGRRVATDEVIRRLRADPDELEDTKGVWEQFLRTHGRAAAEKLHRLLYSTCCYLGNLLGGPVPVLLPRQDVDLLAGANGDGHAPALAIAKSLQRLVRAQVAGLQQPRDEQLLSKIEDMMARVGTNPVPANKRHMGTDRVAALLGVAPKTVRKWFKQGKLIGRKLAGGEWRTTQQDLERSPYWQKSRRGNASLE